MVKRYSDFSVPALTVPTPFEMQSPAAGPPARFGGSWQNRSLRNIPCLKSISPPWTDSGQERDTIGFTDRAPVTLGPPVCTGHLHHPV